MLAGAVVDAIVGDPRRGHPVAAYGRWSGAVERRLYASTGRRGAAFAGVAVGVPVALSWLVDRGLGRLPAARWVARTSVTWAVLGGTTLRREALTMQRLLAADDLVGARAQLASLCGRDAAALDAAGLARATVESVAENTSDAAIAPLFWGAIAGTPGLVGYRCINTLDAMVGHRSERYASFGTACARLDDVANLVPSRLTSLLAIAVAPVVGGRSSEARRVWRRDRGCHPSPNSGQCESAFAGALGVRLGGRNVYGTRVEHRPFLGDGLPPEVADIARAARLSGAVQLVTLALVVLSSAARRRR